LSAQKVDDETFCRLFDQLGAAGVAKVTGLDLRGIYRRRRNLERYVGAILPPSARSVSHPHRIELEVKDGVVLVGSDGHYWPGEPSTAHLAFVQFCKEIPITKEHPVAVIFCGDAFDGASISRHPPIGWENNPTVQHEIETVQERLGEIEAAAGRARKIFPLGNHDARYETSLAARAPEYAKVHGVHLSDHRPLWESCWSCWINNDVVVKHRIKGGTHAAHNNTVAAGKTTVTGHTHALTVTNYNDYNGRRWGVQTGTLADPYGPQFVDYTEDSPRNQHSGFVVLTFRDGKLQWPEVVYVIEDGLVGFRGQIINVNQASIRQAHPQAPYRRRAARSTAPRRADTSLKAKAQAKVRTKARA
jgi:hypothetical protein